MPGPDLRLAVVVACSKAKDPRPGLLPARERYQGRAFARTVAAVDQYRASGRDADLIIVSARFGVVREYQPIPWYEATVPTGRNGAGWRRLTSMPVALVEELARYDAAIVTLPQQYLDAVAVTTWSPSRGVLISSANPNLGTGWRWIRAGAAEARVRHATTREVASILLKETLAAGKILSR
jgi:hypothetical protein